MKSFLAAACFGSCYRAIFF